MKGEREEGRRKDRKEKRRKGRNSFTSGLRINHTFLYCPFYFFWLCLNYVSIIYSLQEDSLFYFLWGVRVLNLKNLGMKSVPRGSFIVKIFKGATGICLLGLDSRSCQTALRGGWALWGGTNRTCPSLSTVMKSSHILCLAPPGSALYLRSRPEIRLKKKTPQRLASLSCLFPAHGTTHISGPLPCNLLLLVAQHFHSHFPFFFLPKN